MTFAVGLTAKRWPEFQQTARIKASLNAVQLENSHKEIICCDAT
jgi:hypothetical protein